MAKRASRSKIDRDAYRRAIEMVRAEGPAQALQMDRDIEREGFIEAGRRAAYHCQCRTLQLKPWEWPPVWIENVEAELSAPSDLSRRHRAAEILKRLMACGLSRHEPDPLAALAAKENPVPEERARG